MKLSVVLATRNEESNIGPCLESVKDIADEIIVVDESSTDKTREIAKRNGAKVYKVEHEPIFHITKQKALEKASGDWILQLDADERVTPPLAKEIKEVINLSGEELKTNFEQKVLNNKILYELFRKHQRLIEKRDGKIGTEGDISAFYIPRRNFFLGEPLIHAGVYPDGVIRLVRRGLANFPAKSVHEQIEIKGRVAWLFNDLEHHDSPTFSRYLTRLNRYTDLHARHLQEIGITKNFWSLVNYSFIKPKLTFLRLYFRHRGYKDGPRGFIWSFFSAMHFPISYFKYLQMK